MKNLLATISSYTIITTTLLLAAIVASQFFSLWPISLSLWPLLVGVVTFKVLHPRPADRIASSIYTFGLGLAMLMILPLMLNSLRWVLDIQQPLSKQWIIIFFVIYILFMLRLGVQRGATLSINFKKPIRISLINITLTLWSLAILSLAYFGSNLLNNTGNNLLSTISTVGVALSPFLVFLASKRMQVQHYVVLLFVMSLGLLLSSSLRSSYLFGSDVINEYRMFELTHLAGYWSPSHINNSYNLCLSITILPQILHALTGMDGIDVFKLGMQIIFSVCPVLIFFIARKQTSNLPSFFAATLFLIFGNYIGSMPNHIRQEIAFIFFTLCIYLLIDSKIALNIRKILFLIFGTSMILAHYSTSYVGLLLLISIWAIALILSKKPLPGLDNKHLTNKTPLTFATLIFFIMVSILWYSQVASTSGGPISYLQNTAQKVISGRDSEQAADTGIGEQFKISNNSLSNQEAFVDLLQNSSNKIGYDAAYVAQDTSKGVANKTINHVLFIASEMLRKSYKGLVLIAIIAVPIHLYRRRNLTITNLAMILASGCLIAISFVIPSFTVDYDQERFFQQILVILSLPAVTTWYILFGTKIKLGSVLLAIFLGLYTIVSSGLSQQLIAGSAISGKYNNNGLDYGRYYVLETDVKAAEWAIQHKEYRGIYADSYGANRIRFVSPKFSPNETFNPLIVPRQSFVYFYHANLLSNQSFQQHKGQMITLTPPISTYNANSDKIYANNAGAIYEKE